MKVAIVYPPVEGKRPLLGQNRQFRYSSSNEVRIYPVVPSSAATLLSKNGFEVAYIDGINTGMSEKEFEGKFWKFNPDLVMMETKTPIIRKHWQIIEDMKRENPSLVTVLVGDHVSFRPEESLENSSVDYVLTGGDYDVSLLALCKSIDGKGPLPKGTWYREGKRIVNTGPFELIKDLDSLPFIDRELTNWKVYGEAYLYHPCTYIMWGRGCSPGKCAFCVWSSNLWNTFTGKARLRSVDNVLKEMESLAGLGVKEVFDDTGTSTWNKRWLRKLCKGIIDKGLNKEYKISCNARADNLDKKTCKLMKKAGFRLLKVGLESGNNSTLKRLNKMETIEDIVRGVKNAKDVGLKALLTIMVGYPWESEENVKRTLKVSRELMLYKTRIGNSLQASVVVPYPGTPLYDECIKNDWFTIDPDDYESYDMSKPILKSPLSPEKIMHYCDEMWRIHQDPKFVAKTLMSARSTDDLMLLMRGAKSVLGHRKDF